jgi:hypothetical protein
MPLTTPTAPPNEQTFDAITQTAALVVCRVLGIRVLWDQAGSQIPPDIREQVAEALATHRVRRAYWRRCPPAWVAF